MAEQKTPTQEDIDRITSQMLNFEGSFNLDKEGVDKNLLGHDPEHNMIFRQEPRTIKQEGAGIGLDQEVRREVTFSWLKPRVWLS